MSAPRFLSLLVAGCVSLPGLALAASVTVRDIDVTGPADDTQVVIALSGATTAPKVFTLDDPQRVVIDLKDARLAPALAADPGKVVGAYSAVKALRAAPRDKSNLRIVLETHGTVTPVSRLLAASGQLGPRIVVELRPQAATTPTAAGAAPSAPPKALKTLADQPERDLVIAIDAGHGGADPGALGMRGTREKDVTLAIARKLKARIDREPGMRAVLTRDGDYFVVLRDRMTRARKQGADMFVSIHADAVRDRKVTGSSVYVLSARGASSEAARLLADQENAADLIGGVSPAKNGDLASVLLDLSQGASMSASIEAADQVLGQLDLVGNVHRTGVQHAAFMVLKSPDIPSMLVETAFISNPQEEAKLKDPAHQARLAEAIHAGVRRYFAANPLPGTLLVRAGP